MDELFKYDCKLNIENFIHMLDDPTECYKFYWLDSIMMLISKGGDVITFDDVISNMIADAWYSVTEYHLRMGTKDANGDSVNSIERAVNKLNKLGILDHSANRATVLAEIKSNGDLLHDEKYQISQNVPYRVLSSFLAEIGGNDRLWDQRTRLIAYMEAISKDRCLPYTIGNGRGLQKKLFIDQQWRKFFQDNMVVIRGWIQMKKIKYLQDRNPGVPGIIYKLEPENEKQRKLQNVRKLWTAVIDVVPIQDIYSGCNLGDMDYEIDHFIPWSYVTNNEMWNLIPVVASFNSSKRDRLPNWNKYFIGFVQNQFVLNESVYLYPEIRTIFEKCKRDNLNSLWPMEELYVKGIQLDKFTRVLENRMKPIYDSAHMQGYGVWTVK